MTETFESLASKGGQPLHIADVVLETDYQVLGDKGNEAICPPEQKWVGWRVIPVPHPTFLRLPGGGQIAAQPKPRQTPAGVPIGHGPLAETAAEPIEFTRLLQHIEHGRLVNKWHDTMPTAPAQFDDTPGTWPACGGSCAENARPCPRPRSCWLSEREDDGMGCIRGLVWAIGITAAAIALALAIASFVGV